MIVYYLGINLIGYFVMWLDKQKAKKGKYRIPENTLGLLALSFASLGMSIAMWQFHHKNRVWYFKYGLPILALLQMVVLIL